MPDDRKEPGDALAWSAADWNAWAAASAGGAAAGHGVGGPIGQAGGVLHDHTPRSAWARLAGAGSPYDWQEVVRDVVAGTWADGAGTGTASAVEINGVAGLAGTIQRITECGPGEWCFQAVQVGGAPPCTTVVVTVLDACTRAAISGVTVTATGPGTTATGTTDASGVATLTLDAAGSWTIQGAKSGYTTGSTTVTVSCGTPATAALDLVATGAALVNFSVQVNGCLASFPGVTVQLLSGTALVASVATNTSGIAIFHPVAGTYTYKAVAPTPRYTDVSGSVTLACNSSISRTLQLGIAAGYACPFTCEGPAATTLFLVDPVLGTASLAYSSPGGIPTWSGSLTASEASTRDATCTTAATRTVRVSYTLQSQTDGSWKLSVAKKYCSSGGINYSVVDGAAGAGSQTVTFSAAKPSPCSPPVLSFSGVLTGGPFFTNVLQQTYGSGSRTFTVSE